VHFISTTFGFIDICQFTHAFSGAPEVKGAINTRISP